MFFLCGRLVLIHSNTTYLSTMWPFISWPPLALPLCPSVRSLYPLFSHALSSDLMSSNFQMTHPRWIGFREHHSGPYARKKDLPMFVHLKRRSRQRLSMAVFSLVVHSSQEPVSHRPRPVQPLSLFSWPGSWPCIPLGLKSLFMLCPQPLNKIIPIMVVCRGFYYSYITLPLKTHLYQHIWFSFNSPSNYRNHVSISHMQVKTPAWICCFDSKKPIVLW